ncbi:CDT1-like protein a, chloroplastic [Olea europaea var. sylvestris]|uniref:CDT1-like protein a, chloroplastic n=1 Tax=Olea europaea var. sylvestris TaxID=158386 RepID=UPI000C1CD86D|nr:CDT1-like protein a, chloroplastic [Olea europaea var. sylvestris]
MESARSPDVDLMKSKKAISSPAPSDEKVRMKAPASDPNPMCVKTPGKPADPPRRLRNRNAVLSIKEIRQAANKLREQVLDPPARPDPLMSSSKSTVGTKSKRKKSSDADITLPEKYELLDQFFNSLDSSIRLLHLKRSAPSFSNISPQIERLTDRRFTYSHLAQLKFIMPEAIVLKKVLLHDERTSCMKPDLHVALNVEAIENDRKTKSDNGNLQLRKVFRARLLAFVKSHPQGHEVPEEVLPEPFSRLQQTNLFRASTSSLRSETSAMELAQEHPAAAASHLSQAFKRSFSRPGSTHYAENLKQEYSVVSIHAPVVSEPKLAKSPRDQETSAFAANSPSNVSVNLASVKCSANVASSASSSPSPLMETPVKNMNSSSEMSTTRRTPAELVYSPAELMSATPVLRTPKRRYMSPNDDSFRSPSKLVQRPPRSKRSLILDTPVKSVKIEDELSEIGKSSIDLEVFDILPETLVESIRAKERKISLEQDPAISQAKWRQKMIAGLPKFFDAVYFFFQSIKRSVITKEELMHKIIVGHIAIVDRREIEEQLRLLQELVPEWIYEKTASSGDLLLCVNKISSPELIRTRLAEAK